MAHGEFLSRARADDERAKHVATAAHLLQ
jgi:hypothetical protein